MRLKISNSSAVCIAVFLVLLASPCALLFAQTATGSIAGVVTDSLGGVIPGARIILTDQATLSGTVVLSGSDGSYRSPPLAADIYTIEVEKDSFRRASQQDFQLEADQHAEINFKLDPGTATEQVEVQANAPALNIFNATLGNVIDNATAETLPLNGHNALALIQLSPGVVSQTSINEGFNDRGLSLSQVRIGGGAIGANANLLDGVNNLQTTRGEVSINPGVTGIQQTRLQYGVVSSEFGFTSGGIISMTSKSGTNAVHGSVYEYLRNDIVNANNAFTLPGTGRPALRYNQYGAAIGGPFKRDHGFYFGNYEAYKLVQTTPSLLSVPTQLERTGDFSDLVCPPNPPAGCVSNLIYDPTSGTTSANRTAFPGNAIPGTSLDPVAVAFQNAYLPAPNTGSAGATTNNFVSNTPLISSQQLSIGRIDYRITNRLSVFLRYAYYENINNNAGLLPSLVASTRNDDLKNQDLAIGITQVLSGNLINDVRFGLDRSYFPFTAGSYNQNLPSKLGMAGVAPTTLPFISIANYPASVVTTVGLRTSLNPEVGDDLTWLHGLHSFHIGMDLRLYEGYNNSNAYPSGNFGFNTSVTANSAQAGSGNAYASFLLGKTSSVLTTVSGGSTLRTYSISGYVQDNWRAFPRLTFDLGLRYDYQAIPWEKHNGFSTLMLNMTNPLNGFAGREVYAGVDNMGRNFANENYLDFQPRAGFALLLSQKHHTVLRGGYGLYYASGSNQLYSNATDGFGTNTTTYTNANNSFGYVSQLSAGLPSAALGLPGAAGGPSALLGQAATVQPRIAKSSASQQFVLAIEHQFAGNAVLSISFIQNHGTHFPLVPVNLNALDPKYFSLGSKLTSGTTKNPYAGMVPGSLGGATLSLTNFLHAYPYFAQVYEYYPHIGRFMGRGLQTQFRRSLITGLNFQGTYTFSKLLSDPLTNPVNIPGSISGSLQNNFAPHSEYSVDVTDVTHRFTGNLTYQLPFGAKQRFFSHTSHAVSQWISSFQLASTLVGESGRPLAFTGTNTVATANRPSFAPGVPLTVAHPNRTQWFNTKAFITPSSPDNGLYAYGNVPRTLSTLRSPGALNVNFQVSKQTQLTTRFRLQIQMDAFNALNKGNLQQPNTSYTSAGFGSISNALPARVLQLSVRVFF